MANNKNIDPPPPYTATEFHGINAPTAAPAGPPPMGFVIPPGPQAQTGKKFIVEIYFNAVIGNFFTFVLFYLKFTSFKLVD